MAPMTRDEYNELNEDAFADDEPQDDDTDAGPDYQPTAEDYAECEFSDEADLYGHDDYMDVNDAW